jgi:hypothetical protein
VNKLRKPVLLIIALLLSTGFVSACTPGSAQPQASPLTDSEVRIFADSIVENILQAMNTGNYAQYTRDFDAQLKKNLAEDIFNSLNAKKLDVVGNYVSKEFWQMTQKNDKVTVVYRAKFTDEPGTVLVTVYFKNITGKWYVDGLLFYSPLMQSNDC